MVKFTDQEKLVFSRIGEVGGRSKSPAKRKAAIKNAAKASAAHIRLYPPCKGGYANGSHRFAPNGRCYSQKCRTVYPDLRQIKAKRK
jgi:hypothetical protein